MEEYIGCDIKIVYDGHITKTIVDGKDMSAWCSKIEFCHEGGMLPEVTLTLIPETVEINTTGNVTFNTVKLR